jgi:hypothetical protein
MVACARRVRARATQGIDPELVQQTREVLAAIKANLATSTVEERIR